MKYLALFLFATLSLVAQKNPASYVNPFIGTGGHGHTFPGAVVPFGMVQLSPDTRIDGSWDGCSGYHYSDSLIYGFTHTHLSGTGCSDFGDILLMPFPGEASVDNKKYASAFIHSNEKASAGYYSVKLNNGVKVELTSTARTGIHKYEFPKNQKQNIILNLTHRDETVSSSLKITGENTIEGERISKAWAVNQHIYFVIEFSKKMDFEIFLDDKSQKENKTKDNYYNGKNIKAILTFNEKGETVYVKVGISNASIEGARKNLQAEAVNWNFDSYKKNAEELWNNELSKIIVKSESKDKLSIFYTALYHCMIHPSLASDVDGSYRGRDMKIHKAEGFDYYSVFSLWDTYRALHPLMTLIDKKRTEDFIKTFIVQYDQGGRLPVWELASNETDCMIGYHSVSVIADAYIKGIEGFDTEKAFKAMKNSAMENRLGLAAYKNNGVISADDEAESVSRTLEYAYDDWCIAQMANKLGKKDEYEYFLKRSKSWENIFDRQTGFMRARKNGDWQQPFDPREVNNNFTEANSYQYSFYVPHDMNGLINAHGSEQQFKKRLQKLFLTPSKTTGREQSDITGLIGQYAHGNEPSHHMAYLFNYVNSYENAVKYIDTICNYFYRNDPDGLIGNEDCGQMSAWYVLSALGIYQVCPGSADFIIGKPQFAEATVKLQNGKELKITRPDNYTYKNASQVSFILNNQPYNKLFINYNNLIKGGNLTFLIEKNKATPDSLPASKELPSASVNVKSFVKLPFIKTTSRSFIDSGRVALMNNEQKGKLYYRTNPSADFVPYDKPFYVNKTSSIETYCDVLTSKSPVVKAILYKRPNNYKVKIIHKYNRQYNGGGDIALLDGIRGDMNWKKGEWQGYQDTDFEAIVEIPVAKEIKSVQAGFLQDTRSWIIFPKQLEVYISEDGKNFEQVGSFKNEIAADDYESKIQNLGGEIDTKNKKVKFIKVKAINYGKLPVWHQGSGGDAFIFTDEIIIE